MDNISLKKLAKYLRRLYWQHSNGKPHDIDSLDRLVDMITGKDYDRYSWFIKEIHCHHEHQD